MPAPGNRSPSTRTSEGAYKVDVPRAAIARRERCGGCNRQYRPRQERPAGVSSYGGDNETPAWSGGDQCRFPYRCKTPRRQLHAVESIELQHSDGSKRLTVRTYRISSGIPATMLRAD